MSSDISSLKTESERNNLSNGESYDQIKDEINLSGQLNDQLTEIKIEKYEVTEKIFTDMQHGSNIKEDNESDHYSSDTDEYEYTEIIQCIYCNIVFPSQKQYKEHMKIHDPTRKYICEICAKGFKKKAYLRYHLLDHSGEKKHPCKFCDKKFATYSAMVTHRRQHEGERTQVINARTKPFICDLCGGRFTTSTSLRSHVKNVHLRIKQVTCHICSKQFFSKSNLDMHLVSHMDEKPFKCKICGVGVTRKGVLRKHMMQHEPNYASEVKPYTGPKEPCPTCKRVYPKRYMKKHLQIHSDVKRVSCPMCDKMFKNEGTLKIHLKTHSSEKPYFCEYCGKKFKVYNTMKDHTRKHQGDLPYKCDKCSWAFVSKSKLKAHSKVHTKDNTRSSPSRKELKLNCSYCNQKFENEMTLTAHLNECTFIPVTSFVNTVSSCNVVPSSPPFVTHIHPLNQLEFKTSQTWQLQTL